VEGLVSGELGWLRFRSIGKPFVLTVSEPPGSAVRQFGMAHDMEEHIKVAKQHSTHGADYCLLSRYCVQLQPRT
jgi:hypothetical protein